MKFPYKRYSPTVLRPVIPVNLKSGNKSIAYEALVDSGADLCLFDAELGEYLGIEVKAGKKREVFGVGGKASIYYLNKITVEVGGWSFEIEAGFMFGVSGNQLRYGVLGQRGFFDQFKSINFDYNKGDVELKFK